jgi:uncharacterized protein (DUF1684 family)
MSPARRAARPASQPGIRAALDLADWRRQVGEAYAAVRRHPDPETAWEIWRVVRDALIRAHPMSPLDPAEQAAFVAAPFYPYRPEWRFAVALDAPPPGGALSLDLGDDGLARLTPVDATGGELTLFRLEGYAGGLILPFADATSGWSTYPGGRYALDTSKGADLGLDDERLIVDFNFAYNPSCAYAPRWTCPLAPAENRLPRAIEAGERRAR